MNQADAAMSRTSVWTVHRSKRSLRRFANDPHQIFQEVAFERPRLQKIVSFPIHPQSSRRFAQKWIGTSPQSSFLHAHPKLACPETLPSLSSLIALSVSSIWHLCAELSERKVICSSCEKNLSKRSRIGHTASVNRGLAILRPRRVRARRAKAARPRSLHRLAS